MARTDEATALAQSYANPASYQAAMNLAQQIAAQQAAPVQQLPPMYMRPPVAYREAPISHNAYNMPGSREAWEQYGIPPVVVQSDPYARLAFSAGPGGSVAPLIGFPSVYPHVLNGVATDTVPGSVDRWHWLAAQAQNPVYLGLLGQMMQQRPRTPGGTKKKPGTTAKQPPAEAIPGPTIPPPEVRYAGMPRRGDPYEGPQVERDWLPAQGWGSDSINVTYPAPTGPTGRVAPGTTFGKPLSERTEELKTAAQYALPVVGGALGSVVMPGVGAAGAALGTWAAGQLTGREPTALDYALSLAPGAGRLGNQVLRGLSNGPRVVGGYVVPQQALPAGSAGRAAVTGGTPAAPLPSGGGGPVPYNALPSGNISALRGGPVTTPLGPTGPAAPQLPAAPIATPSTATQYPVIPVPPANLPSNGVMPHAFPYVQGPNMSYGRF